MCKFYKMNEAETKAMNFKNANLSLAEREKKYNEVVRRAKQNLTNCTLAECGFISEDITHWQTYYIITVDSCIRLFDWIYYTIGHQNDRENKKIKSIKTKLSLLIKQMVEVSEENENWAVKYLSDKINEMEKSDLDNDNVLDVFDYKDPLFWKANYFNVNDTLNSNLKNFEHIINHLDNKDDELIVSYKKNKLSTEIWIDNVVDKIVSLY